MFRQRRVSSAGNFGHRKWSSECPTGRWCNFMLVDTAAAAVSQCLLYIVCLYLKVLCHITIYLCRKEIRVPVHVLMEWNGKEYFHRVVHAHVALLRRTHVQFEYHSCVTENNITKTRRKGRRNYKFTARTFSVFPAGLPPWKNGKSLWSWVHVLYMYMYACSNIHMNTYIGTCICNGEKYRNLTGKRPQGA